MLFSLCQGRYSKLSQLCKTCEEVLLIDLYLSLKNKHKPRALNRRQIHELFFLIFIICLENTYINSLHCLEEIRIASVSVELVIPSGNTIMHFDMDYAFDSMNMKGFFWYIEITIERDCRILIIPTLKTVYKPSFWVCMCGIHTAIPLFTIEKQGSFPPVLLLYFIMHCSQQNSL